MAATQVELVTPDKTLFSGEVEMVAGRTAGGGEIAFLADHTAFLGALEPGLLRLIHPGGSEDRYAVHGGFVEVRDNRVVILADVAERAEDIDLQRARRALEGAGPAGEDEDEAAAGARRRAEVRIAVAEGGEGRA